MTLRVSIEQSEINIAIAYVMNWAVVFDYLLQEDDSFLLQEDGVSKIALG